MGIFDSFLKKVNFIHNKKELQDEDGLSKRDKRIIAEFKKQMEELKENATPTHSGIASSFMSIDPTGVPSGFGDDVYLYDFVQEYNNHGQSLFVPSISIDSSGNASYGGDSEKKVTTHTLILSEDMKLHKERVYKPIEVFNELVRVPTPASLENLEDKILVLKSKEKLMRSNAYAKKEVIDLVLRLENRRKYEQFKDFFERFDNTTLENVEQLVDKYGLSLQTIDLFIPKFPDDAIKIMDDYSAKTKELCDKLPVFYVIAEKKMFRDMAIKHNRRNDPILLVQSPFGQYFQILGAWDKELILLEEL